MGIENITGDYTQREDWALNTCKDYESQGIYLNC